MKPKQDRSKLLIVSCTQQSDPAHTLLHQSRSCLERKPPLKMYTNNKEGLSKMYNRALEEYGDNYDKMLFVHDDVWLDDEALEYKLSKAFRNYDIVGVAGTLSPQLKYPSLWHIMGNRDSHRGYAGHLINKTLHKDGDPVYVSSFGPTPSRVVLADGLFIAVNVRKVLDAGWRWNENFTFHHYDLASCLDANKLGLKIGVYPINLFHASPGLSSLEDPTWNQSHKKFEQLYF